MSFKTIFQDTTAEDKVIKYFERKFTAIEARLSSIEKLLSAESKPQEPEWRPMSEVPLDREIIVNHQSVAYFASYHFGFDAWECTPDDRNSMYFYFKYEDLSGWCPL